MNRFSFTKKERLCSRTLTKALFKSGKSFLEYPIRVQWKSVSEQEANSQLLISVPKRRFKKAVDRNRLKRLIRESYRLNKTELLNIWQEDGKYFALAFVYIGNNIVGFDQIDSAMKNIVKKLSRLEKR
jgi:ribonuclease P protein component